MRRTGTRRTGTSSNEPGGLLARAIPADGSEAPPREICTRAGTQETAQAVRAADHRISRPLACTRCCPGAEHARQWNKQGLGQRYSRRSEV